MSSQKRGAAFILVAGLLVRIALLLTQTPIFWPDSPAYFNWATDLAAGDNFIDHAVYRTPGFPYLLALILKFTSNPALCFLILQYSLGIIASLIIFKIFFDRTSLTIASVAALLFSLNPLQLYYESVVQTECLFTFLLVCWLWWANRLITEQHVASGIGLGAITAALALTRPLGQLLIVVPLLLALIYRRDIVSWLRLTAAIAVTYIILITPWILHNRNMYGHNGLSIDLGLNAYHRAIDQDLLPIPTDRDFRSIARPATRKRLRGQDSYMTVMHLLHREEHTWVEGDRRMLEFALKSISLAPKKYAASIPRVFVLSLFWPDHSPLVCESESGPFLCNHAENIRQHYQFPDTPTEFVEWLRSPVAFFFELFSSLYRLIIPLFIFGIALRARRLGFKTFLKSDGLFLFTILYFTSITALINSQEDRFRLPFEGILFFYLASVLELFERRDKRDTARSGAVN